MIYTALSASAGTPTTALFKEKKVDGHVVGRMRDVPLFVLPLYKQLAFSGYKDNIEAFVLATATGKKVFCGLTAYKLPDYTVTIPLPLPALVFRSEKPLTSEQVNKILAGLKDDDVAKIDIGKGNPTFTVERPSWANIDKIVRVSKLFSPQVDRHMQMKLVPDIKIIYAFVDLFCRTNTYSARAPTVGNGNNKKMTYAEYRVTGLQYRDGFSQSVGDHPASGAKKIRTLAPGEAITVDEAIDLTPAHSGAVLSDDTVLIAKPSPKPSSASWGTPQEVPNSPGILFPYFKGLLKADAAYLRTTIMSLMARSFGNSDEDIRTNLSGLRKDINSFAETDAGILMCHVLKGIEIGLESQSQIFYLFDEGEYLGFVVLGDQFKINTSKGWVEHSSAEVLRAELNMILTHDGVLRNLAVELEAALRSAGGMDEVTAEDIDTDLKLAKVLARIDVKGGSDEEKKIIMLLRKRIIPTKYKSIQSSNDLVWAIEQLTTKIAEPLEEDTALFIPLQGWKGLDDKEFQVFCAFGSRSFSFRNTKGTELTIAKATELCPFTKRESTGDLMYPNFLVMEQPVRQAFSSWKDLVRRRSLCMDFKERASGSRNVVIRDEEAKGKILGALKVAANANLFGVESLPEIQAGKKRTAEMAFGQGDVDELF